MISASATRHILKAGVGGDSLTSLINYQPTGPDPRVVAAELKLEKALRMIREARTMNPIAAADRHREAGRVARRAAHVLLGL